MDNKKIIKINREHKKRVLEISAKIWEGNDYIPFVFDHWINDQNGEFLGVEAEGQLIGFGRYFWQDSNTVWLEGLRKDPDSNIKGLASFMNKHIMEKLSASHPKLRFSTYFGNTESIRASEKAGFRRIKTLSLLSRDIPEQIPSLANTEYNDLVLFTEPVDSYKLIKRSNYLQNSSNFVTKGWVVYNFDNHFCEFFIKNENLLTIRKDKSKGFLLWLSNHEVNTFWISIIEADGIKEILFLLHKAELIALKQNKSRFETVVPTDSSCHKLLLEAGFTAYEQDNDFFLYEIQL